MTNKNPEFSLITEAQAERLHDLRAMAPLTYRPAIDNELINRGLACAWGDGLAEGIQSTEAGNAACDAYYVPRGGKFDGDESCGAESGEVPGRWHCGCGGCERWRETQLAAGKRAPRAPQEYYIDGE